MPATRRAEVLWGLSATAATGRWAGFCELAAERRRRVGFVAGIGVAAAAAALSVVFLLPHGGFVSGASVSSDCRSSAMGAGFDRCPPPPAPSLKTPGRNL